MATVQAFSELPRDVVVLEEIGKAAERDDFLPHKRFGEICKVAGIPAKGPSSKDSLLDLFDKLGIVIHFPKLPFLSEFILNPQWLTYGVYTIMYSDRAKDSQGRIWAQDVVRIFQETLSRMLRIDGCGIRPSAAGRWWMPWWPSALLIA